MGKRREVKHDLVVGYGCNAETTERMKCYSHSAGKVMDDTYFYVKIAAKFLQMHKTSNLLARSDGMCVSFTTDVLLNLYILQIHYCSTAIYRFRVYCR